MHVIAPDITADVHGRRIVTFKLGARRRAQALELSRGAGGREVAWR